MTHEQLAVVLIAGQGIVLLCVLVLGGSVLYAIRQFGRYTKAVTDSSRIMADAMRFEASMHEANLMMAKQLLRGRREV